MSLTDVITNEGEKIIYTPNIISVLEEADNRIICHILDILESGLSRISVKTSDSDVVIILLGFIDQFLNIVPELELFVDFNTGTNRKYININACYISLGKDICFNLPFFHCFTGADSTCSFFKLLKKDWYSHWMIFPLKDSLNTAFQALSSCLTKEYVLNTQEIIQMFVAYAYSKKIDYDLDELRFNMFQKLSSNELRSLPPSNDALLLHTFRCAYQAGWVWGNSLTQCNPPPPELWGWKIYKDHLCIQWTSLDINYYLQMTFSICRCRTISQCKCAKNKILCLKYRNCCRKCGNI